MYPQHLLDEVIRPVLFLMDKHSVAAEELLLGTAAQESYMGKYLVQLGNGPARGIYQMEMRTHDDIVQNYLKYRPGLEAIRQELLVPVLSTEENLVVNLAYATFMARVHYLRVSDPLPRSGDLMAQAKYWKDHYNTYLGAGTIPEYVENYHRHVISH